VTFMYSSHNDLLQERVMSCSLNHFMLNIVSHKKADASVNDGSNM
jgi:hypothetical protein